MANDNQETLTRPQLSPETEEKMLAFLAEDARIDQIISAGTYLVLCKAAELDPTEVLDEARMFLAEKFSSSDEPK